jgi:hypothetical protein
MVLIKTFYESNKKAGVLSGSCLFYGVPIPAKKQG